MKISPYVFPGVKGVNIRHLTNPKRRKVNHIEILKIISRNYKTTVEDIISKSRKGPLVEARHLYCAIMKHEFGYTLKEIGEINNGRDHTTIIHSLKTHKNRLETEEDYKSRAEIIINKINEIF